MPGAGTVSAGARVGAGAGRAGAGAGVLRATAAVSPVAGVRYRAMTQPAGPLVCTLYQVTPLPVTGPSRMGTVRPSARMITTWRSVPGPLRTRSPDSPVPTTVAIPPADSRSAAVATGGAARSGGADQQSQQRRV